MAKRKYGMSTAQMTKWLKVCGVLSLVFGIVACADMGTGIGITTSVASFFGMAFFPGIAWLLTNAFYETREGLERVEFIKDSSDEKKCPRCAEIVKAEANVCRSCQHEFVITTTTSPAQ